MISEKIKRVVGSRSDWLPALKDDVTSPIGFSEVTVGGELAE